MGERIDSGCSLSDLKTLGFPTEDDAPRHALPEQRGKLGALKVGFMVMLSEASSPYNVLKAGFTVTSLTDDQLRIFLPAARSLWREGTSLDSMGFRKDQERSFNLYNRRSTVRQSSADLLEDLLGDSK